MSETSGFNGEARARIRRAVRRVEAGDAGRSSAPGGASQPPTTVRVTDGTPDGDGLYEAVVTRWDRGSADWEDHGSCRLKPANGQTLTEDVRYDANPVGLTADGHLLFVTTDGSGGSLGDAGYTQRGAVNLEGQTFRGSKAVKDGVGDVEAEAAAEIHLTVGSVDPTAVVSGGTFQGGVTEDAPDGCSVRSYLVGTGGSWTDVGGHSGLGGAYAPYNVGVVGADVLVYPGSTVYGVELVLDPWISGVVVQGTGTPAVVCPQYAWYPNGGSLDDREDGKTGTLSDGSAVKGGIITDIDDGSGFFTGTVP